MTGMTGWQPQLKGLATPLPVPPSEAGELDEPSPLGFFSSPQGLMSHHTLLPEVPEGLTILGGCSWEPGWPQEVIFQ